MSHNLKLSGAVRPPADVHGAARASLSASAYADLMNQTGGEPPTPAQLCAAAELERAQTRADAPLSAAQIHSGASRSRSNR